MIVSLKGKFVESQLLSIVVDVSGLGYEVNVPLSTLERLPKPGEEILLFTVAVYREDSQALYGFISREDRDFFRLLVEKVSGIGPKIALSILSKMSVPLLKSAIADADISLLSQCPGIGKKTAERLSLELRDKVFSMDSPPTPGENGNGSGNSALLQDATAALIALGYKQTQADKSVRTALKSFKETPTTESLIKKALN